MKNENHVVSLGQDYDMQITLPEFEDGVEYDHFEDELKLPLEEDTAKLLLGHLMPIATAGADVAAQYGQAIVKFPPGKTWADLIDRTKPGWEGWKTVATWAKDGKKFDVHAAIKQVGLSPTAVAGLALQVGAMVVGQAYMTEINQQLKGIESGIEAIQQEMKMEKEAKLQACYMMLLEYESQFEANSTGLGKRDVVRGQLESIKQDVLTGWNFKMKSVDAMAKRVLSEGKIEDEEASKLVEEFQFMEMDVRALFLLLAMTEQVSMQYDKDFGSARIQKVREKLDRHYQVYDEKRAALQSALVKAVNKAKGDLFALPEKNEDNYQPQNPLLDAVHAVMTTAPRITPFALRNHAKGELKEKKIELAQKTYEDSYLLTAYEERSFLLDRLDFIYNRTNAMVVDETGVKFVIVA